ncbi:MAG: hypothetical protein WCI27_08415, partial [Candidatus Omnitrophota bacterium]
EDWQVVLKALFPSAVMLNYDTPGIGLALALRRQLPHGPSGRATVVFIQNHGLIVSADTMDEVIALNEDVLLKAEAFLGCDMTSYKMTNKVSAMINRDGLPGHIVFLSEDVQIGRVAGALRPFLFVPPFFPDGVVFCGAGAVELGNLEDDHPVGAYRERYGIVPAVIVYRQHVFFVAENVRKARDVEDVFKVHLMALELARGQVRSLPDAEVSFLGQWEAEKYRKK